MLLSPVYGESHRECAEQAGVRASDLSAVSARGAAGERRILDEFCQVTRSHRKHAIRLLNGPAPGAARAPQRRARTYSPAVIEALRTIWEGGGRPAAAPAGPPRPLRAGPHDRAAARAHLCPRHLAPQRAAHPGRPRLSARPQTLQHQPEPAPGRPRFPPGNIGDGAMIPRPVTFPNGLTGDRQVRAWAVTGADADQQAVRSLSVRKRLGRGVQARK
jgi:hypothetical protein